MNPIFRALRWFTIALLLSGAGANALAAGYYAQAGKIYAAGGQEIQVRGINHFGFNSDILQPQFLWAMGWKEQIAQIKSLGFNAIRVPFVPDVLYSTTPINQLGSYVHPTLNADLIGKTPLQVLDLWMAEANRQGMYIMLDFHSVSKQRLYPTWFVSNPVDFNLIYNNQAYTTDFWKRDLAFVATRYANLPYFFAIDLFNEPNGVVRWSAGDPNVTDPAYFWKAATESAAAAVLAANPNLLIFVEGITGNYDGIENSTLPMNWGENLQPQAYQPLNIPIDKLVLSPHTYGPDVYAKTSFSAANFPANLAAHWEALFGKFSPTHPVILGEWGGNFGQGVGGQSDVTWQNALVQYLLGKGIRNSFYWCYTPNSGDTGGILDNNLNVRQDKMALLRQLWGTAAPLAELSLSTSAYSVAQNVGSVTISVNRSVSSSGAVSVNYASANGSALAGSDYTATSGTLNWTNGDSAAKTFVIPISNSTPLQGSKTFSVTLWNASSGAALGAMASATVTILSVSSSCADIMPLGDSITLGVNGGYRNNLYTGLTQNNCGVNYVGTQFDQYTRVVDKDHEGHPGFTIGDIARDVNPWLATTLPNIILLMIGTNDTAWWSAENANQIGARHNALIDQLRTARPNAWIFVASIAPQSSAIIQPNNVDRAQLTQQLNAVIGANVAARVAAGQRVRFVDVNSVLTTADLYDGIHPTEAAHAKIAQKFLDVMRATLINVAPSVTLLANPATVNSGGSATLTWNSSASSCAASGAWSGVKASNGSQVLTNLNATRDYTLRCSGAGGSTSQTVTISVSGG